MTGSAEIWSPTWEVQTSSDRVNCWVTTWQWHIHRKHTNANTDPKRKKKQQWRYHEKNHVWNENPVGNSQEPRLKDSKVWNWEWEWLIDKYPDKDITELNDLINAGSKIARGKNRGPLEVHGQKVKTRVGTQTRITDKKDYENKQKD